MSRNCICIICIKPNDIWIDFLSTFKQYDIVFIIDDNSEEYAVKYADKKNIQCIQIKEEDCSKNGFIDVNALSFDKITGWEKAVYYFAKVNTTYNQIWFIEDDVFLHNEETILNIDKQYPISDLLTAPYEEKIRNNWHWRSIKIQFPPPYFHAMVCAVRMSGTLLSTIREYAETHKTLFFLEALFPSLCKANGLVYDTPTEMKHIVHMGRYQKENVDVHHLYHPLKDINKHVLFRQK